MPSTREIKRRIQSAKSSQQITGAMKMVSAAKLYKSQRTLLASRPYSQDLLKLFATVCASTSNISIPLLSPHDSPSPTTLVILITGNRGLAGGFNHTLIRQALALDSKDTIYAAVGRKGYAALKIAGCALQRDFCDLGDIVGVGEAAPISSFAIDAFEQGRVGSVKVVYQQFISAGHQEPQVADLLPFPFEQLNEGHSECGDATDNYLFEGQPHEILDMLSRRCVLTALTQMLMECKTSEHIARMMTMGAASDNAAELVKKLQLDYNRSRQAVVTREIAEISGCINTII